MLHCPIITLAIASPTGGSLTTLDWLIVGAYLLLLLVSGLWLARREPSGSKEYFVASRRMPAWAVVFSILASSLSVATFIGGPEQSFKGNLTYLSTNIGGVIAIMIVAWVFIPAFYKADCVSIYELLERRMGRGAKQASSAAFMIGRTFASGARVYIAAIPIAALLFGLDQKDDPWVLVGAIAILSFVAIMYTLVGGIASVIWTDVIQTLVMLGAVIAAIVFLYNRIPASTSEIVQALSTAGVNGTSKLKILDPGIPFDPTVAFTLFTAVIAFTMLNLAAYGTDHDMVQRMLTCKSAVQGGRSAITAILTGIPVVAMFLTIGLLLFVFYRMPALMGANAPGYDVADNGQPFLVFIVRELPTGLAGVMVAGLFAVGLGSLNSAINAMAATFIKDFYMHSVPNKSERHYLIAGRWAVAGWGVLLALVAIFCIFWKRAMPETTLIDFALGVMNLAFAGLLAVFLTAIFTSRGSSKSAIAALLTGFVVVLFFQQPLWLNLARLAPSLLGLGEGTITPAGIKNHLPWLTWAYPWHLVIAVPIAFAVCCTGRRPVQA